MYSNIYQLTKVPVKRTSWIDKSSFYGDPFIGDVANYVEDTDSVAALYALERWLTEQRLGTMTGRTIVFAPDGAERYFQSRFSGFHDAAQKLASVTAQQYVKDCAGTENLLWQLRQAFSEKFGDYVYDDDEDLIPMDIFLRSVEPGTVYHIGGICKYQY